LAARQYPDLAEVLAGTHRRDRLGLAVEPARPHLDLARPDEVEGVGDVTLPDDRRLRLDVDLLQERREHGRLRVREAGEKLRLAQPVAGLAYLPAVGHRDALLWQLGLGQRRQAALGLEARAHDGPAARPEAQQREQPEPA